MILGCHDPLVSFDRQLRSMMQPVSNRDNYNHGERDPIDSHLPRPRLGQLNTATAEPEQQLGHLPVKRPLEKTLGDSDPPVGLHVPTLRLWPVEDTSDAFIHRGIKGRCWWWVVGRVEKPGTTFSQASPVAIEPRQHIICAILEELTSQAVFLERIRIRGRRIGEIPHSQLPRPASPPVRLLLGRDYHVRCDPGTGEDIALKEGVVRINVSS